MTNIEKNFSFQKLFAFYASEAIVKMYQEFLKSDLGAIYQAIPWNEIVKDFGITTHHKGPKNIFSPKGQIALMFLKAYSGESDKKIIEQINAGNLYYRFFCNLCAMPGKKMIKYKIVSQIRCELSTNVDIEKIQMTLAQYWKPHMKDLSKVLMDATCYESSVRYPTDQKLLWESTTFLYKVFKSMCKQKGIKLKKTQYDSWKKKYKAYSRTRHKTKKARMEITAGLLELVKTLDETLDDIEKNFTFEDNKATYESQRKVIKNVIEQQTQIHEQNTHPKSRVVSLFKPYLRPIVRGKEHKNVEFGAKVNKIQIDGVNFIEKLSFEAFNEGIRFEESIQLAQKITGTKMEKVGADGIYNTQSNCAFAASQGIITDFVPKGKADAREEKNKEEAKKLRKERASHLEGSFGNEKEHYGLNKIKGRTKKTEILLIFFGIHTANALKIGKRIIGSFKT